MNFSRVSAGAINPVSNRFIAAILATFAALIITTFGSGQWASADGGTTVPDPEPDPPASSTLGAPRHVLAKAGDESAAVAWNRPAGENLVIDGYVVTADPSGIVFETTHDDTLVIVEGLENGTEYTFTVVAFNGDGRGAVSEPSNPVTPEEGLELNEEQLDRLRAHLRKLAHEAKERLDNAKERAREQLAKSKHRIDEWLHKQRERAGKHLDKKIEKARQQENRKVEHADKWLEHLKAQLRKKVERAEGTDRYEEVKERAVEKLHNAEEKVDDRLEQSREKALDRIEKAKENTEKRIRKAGEKAGNILERAEQRLTDKVSKFEDRLHELLRRLRQLWLERAEG